MTHPIDERAAILAALAAWIAQRPGLDPRDYIRDGADTEGRRAYFSESRRITKQRRDARELLAHVREVGMTLDTLRGAFRAYSGRLTWRAQGARCETCRGTGKLHSGNTHDVTGEPTPARPCYTCEAAGVYPRSELAYVTGQYWPTEYRAAACAVLASALWDHYRAQLVPDGKQHVDLGNFDVDTYGGLSFRDAVKRELRRAGLSRSARAWID